jgi:ferredoxin-NADP reductase
MNLTLDHKQAEAGDAVSFFFRAEQPLSWKPGQYLHYALSHPNPDERGQERWFTNAAAPHEGLARITTRLASENGSSFKRALAALPVGGTIQADPPEGDFTVEDSTGPLVFIAGGIGITPFRSIAADRDHRGLPLPITLLYANRTEDTVFREELGSIAARHPEFKISYFIGDRRIDEQAIREQVPDLASPTFYVSGPEPMVKAFEKMLLGMGVPDDHLKRDDFPGYDWP